MLSLVLEVNLSLEAILILLWHLFFFVGEDFKQLWLSTNSECGAGKAFSVVHQFHKQ